MPLAAACLALLFAAPLRADGLDSSLLHALHLDRLDEPAPVFNIADSKSVSECRGGWLLVHFWATWCSTCVRELPALERLHARAEDAGVTILTVLVDPENEARAKSMARKLAPHLPLVSQDVANADVRYWNFGLPVTYLVDADGRLRARALGARDWDSPEGLALVSGLPAADPRSRCAPAAAP
jgi:thiol-disulfide isomerase/thioredoxin